jgi:hypothetical protein
MVNASRNHRLFKIAHTTIGLVKGLHDLIKLIRGNPDAVAGDRPQAIAGGIDAAADGDATALAGELHGVGQQVARTVVLLASLDRSAADGLTYPPTWPSKLQPRPHRRGFFRGDLWTDAAMVMRAASPSTSRGGTL